VCVRPHGARGQSTVEFGASALVLILVLFGLIDLGRVFYYDVGLQGATREGARAASWFDPQSGTNPNLYDTAIANAVDGVLNRSGLPNAALGNPATTCPAPADGNTVFNPPYQDSAYPTAVNQPVLFICYANTPGLDLTTAPGNNSYKAADVNVILVMSFGFASGLMQGVVGPSVHIVANTHMVVGGY
jgi:Flp pilus assembly protein TadG